MSSYATFSPGKNWETIRTTIIYNNANVKMAGHHAGIMTGPDGATHQATEDIAITRCWPMLKVIVPCDAIEAKKATIKAATIEGPIYLRFSRDKTPIITTADSPYDLGKILTFWTSESPVTTIFSTGYMTYYALLAAKELEQERIRVTVANVATIKPLDEKTILSVIEKTKSAVTVEDHQVVGGLGGAISEVLAKTKPTPIEFIGLQDTFAESGSPKELIEKYGMGTNSIKEAVKKVIQRK
jgi:transketolase